MMLDVIDQAVEHSDSIISDMLDYSREINLQLEECSTKSVINYVILSVKKPKKIKIIERIQDANVWLDANKIQRVFVNLVENSFDAMPNGGQLEISSHQEGENYSFIFVDTGSGMSEEVISKIFTPLFTTKAQGMGLGLAICKRFIEAHNGKISFQSTQNQGTTFKVTLPIHSNYACKDK
jgi:signal transduction histidine kinase